MWNLTDFSARRWNSTEITKLIHGRHLIIFVSVECLLDFATKLICWILLTGLKDRISKQWPGSGPGTHQLAFSPFTIILQKIFRSLYSDYFYKYLPLQNEISHLHISHVILLVWVFFLKYFCVFLRADHINGNCHWKHHWHLSRQGRVEISCPYHKDVGGSQL